MPAGGSLSTAGTWRVMMSKRRRSPPTELNEYDRKILGKYTGFYASMAESNKIKAELHKSEPYVGKE